MERIRGLAQAPLPGVGEWTTQAVLLRGCSVADEVPLGDEISGNALAWW